MIKFYDVDKNYINFLRSIDDQIPDFDYLTHDKFVCGVVLEINGVNYFAPISHFNIQQKTNFIIRDNGRAISSIRFCFMFPAPWDVLVEKNFANISLTDQNYANLYLLLHLQSIFSYSSKMIN